MPQSLPTVKIKANNEQGFIVINESDFDPYKHELLVDQKQTEKLIEQEEEPKRRGRPPSVK